MPKMMPRRLKQYSLTALRRMLKHNPGAAAHFICDEIQHRTASHVRPTHTYRFAKRNRAKAEFLVWRRLPRIYTRTGQMIVDI